MSQIDIYMAVTPEVLREDNFSSRAAPCVRETKVQVELKVPDRLCVSLPRDVQHQLDPVRPSTATSISDKMEIDVVLC